MQAQALPAMWIAASLLLVACGDSMDPRAAIPEVGGGETAPLPVSLPSVTSGPKPGPALLYAPAPAAPQLENVAPWTALPILISGASAYREGEFLYQDFLHDDRGAAGVQDPNDPQLLSGKYLFSPKAGTLTYPSDPVFAQNAADLVELRVKPLAAATAIRVTLNTLLDAEKVAFTIALGTSAAAVDWPRGAGVSSPAQIFLTVHGASAEVYEPASGKTTALPASSVAVDLRRRQFDLRLPHTVFDPGQGKLRMAAGVGLWDAAAQQYLQPSVTASATQPGGAAPSMAALFNLAFRYHEPFPDYTVLGAALTTVDAAAAAIVEAKWWREFDQAAALQLGDVSAFFAEVDFAKLAARTSDESAVPSTGPLVRIFPSRFEFGQGLDHAQHCDRFPASCEGSQRGQLQSYSLYVPTKPLPARGYGLTLQLHALSGIHSLYNGSKYQSQFGERGAGSLVLTPGARGPNGDYTDVTEADVFEAWADVARHYRVDPDWTALSGYSMGGGGTYKLAMRWPDLFARATGAAAVAIEDQGSYLPPLRNIPLLTWIGTLDEGSATEISGAISRATAAGLRFALDAFTNSEHLTVYTNNEWAPAAEFLGEHRVDRNPPHITYFVVPSLDSDRAGMVADHAYWLSAVKPRDAAGIGKIDVRSEGFGLGDAPVLGTVTSIGLLQGGTHGPTPYQRTTQDWGEAPKTPIADRLVIEASNIAAVTVDVQRARLSCAAAVQVNSDGPMRVELAGCNRVVTVN